MRGTIARKLRNVAKGILLSQKVELMEGYNVYNTAMNSKQVETDVVEGQNVVKVVDAPGTITCAWRLRVLYQLLKREYRDTWREYTLDENKLTTGRGVVPTGT